MQESMRRIYQKFHVPVMDDLDGPKLMMLGWVGPCESEIIICVSSVF